MRYRVLESLKALALRGAASGFIPVKTVDLSEWLGVSQQTASNRLIELIDQGFVERRWGPKGNSVAITKDGLALLSREYEDLKTIFGEHRDEMEFKGVYEKGIGEGKYYIEQKGYQKQFKKCLGFTPRFGTFNIKLSTQEALKLHRLKGREGLPITGFVTNGRTFGAGKCFKAKIADIDCAVMIPNRTHYTDVLEVISSKCLRKELDLDPGDGVEISIIL